MTHEKEQHHTSHPHNTSKMWIAISSVLFVLFIVFFILFLTKSTGMKGTMTGNLVAIADNTDVNKIANDTTLFISQYVAPGVTLKEASQENGMIRVLLSVPGDAGTQDVNVFASEDGKLIFLPQGTISKADFLKELELANVPETIPKTDVPKVEVFIMSHCPYGTQIEKGLLPVVDILQGKADIQVKFVNYTLHGQKETTEQLVQYCIQENERMLSNQNPPFAIGYFNYLGCFLADGNSDRCLADAPEEYRIALSGCVAKIDADYSINANQPKFVIYDAENQAYGVEGSPTTVINGVVVKNMGRDSQSILTAVCSAFNTAPDECNTVLSSDVPAPGFGYTGSASASSSSSCS